jgi:branched-chain amino acid transport system ATP-binding protein
MEILKLENITKSFGETHILNGASLSFEKGKIHTLIGGNGAGKTTLFNIITGFIKPDHGKIWFLNKQIENLSPVNINKKGITRTFQDLRIITQLTVKENILLAFKDNPGEKITNAILPSFLYRKPYSLFDQKAELILEKVHLKELKNNLAGEISYGQQKLLTIGCCLANDAELLLLDEPIAGIDSINYKSIYDLILQLKKDCKTILQIEHNHKFVQDLSDTITFINEGQTYLFNDFDTFVTDPIVKKSYLN